jgi:hypothetical protein
MKNYGKNYKLSALVGITMQSVTTSDQKVAKNISEYAMTTTVFDTSSDIQKMFSGSLQAYRPHKENCKKAILELPRISELQYCHWLSLLYGENNYPSMDKRHTYSAIGQLPRKTRNDIREKGR